MKCQKVELNCYFCGKTIFRLPSRVRHSKTGKFFCCREHQEFASKTTINNGKITPNYFDRPIDPRAYRTLMMSFYPATCCETCQYAEHIEILEVHHIDSNRRNNKLDNLIWLCPNCHRGITLGYAELEERKIIWK